MPVVGRWCGVRRGLRLCCVLLIRGPQLEARAVRRRSRAAGLLHAQLFVGVACRLGPGGRIHRNQPIHQFSLRAELSMDARAPASARVRLAQCVARVSATSTLHAHPRTSATSLAGSLSDKATVIERLKRAPAEVPTSSRSMMASPHTGGGEVVVAVENVSLTRPGRLAPSDRAEYRTPPARTGGCPVHPSSGHIQAISGAVFAGFPRIGSEKIGRLSDLGSGREYLLGPFGRAAVASAQLRRGRRALSGLSGCCSVMVRGADETR